MGQIAVKALPPVDAFRLSLFAGFRDAIFLGNRYVCVLHNSCTLWFVFFSHHFVTAQKTPHKEKK